MSARSGQRRLEILCLVRTSHSAPPRCCFCRLSPLTAGRYENALFGPVEVRVQGSGLTFQMNRGQVAELDYDGENAVRSCAGVTRSTGSTSARLVRFEGSGRSIDHAEHDDQTTTRSRRREVR